MAKILLIEDDAPLAAELRTHLQSEKHIVDIVHNFKDAQAFLQRFEYDALIIDWQLPDGSGLDLCQQLRNKGCTTPMLMLTGKSELEERMAGLDSGADDYVCKPFNAEELSARIRALLRRSAESVQELSMIGDISIDTSARTVSISGSEVRLRPREFALLTYLIEQAGSTITHKNLRDKVWWDEENVERNTINAMAARLRKKLQEAGSKVGITSVAGEGFRLDA